MEKTEALLFFTPGFPSDENDSTCLPLQQTLILSMQRQFPERQIIICSFHYPHRREQYSWHGIPVISFHGGYKGGLYRYRLWSRLKKALLPFEKLYAIKGVISFFCGESALLAKWYSKKTQTPFVSWILGQDARDSNSFIKRIKPKPEELVALSEFIREEFEKNHQIKPAHLIEPGIDPALFGEKPAQRNIDILAAGSLIPLKRYALFVDIVRRISQDIPGLKVTLAGKGPEEKEILFAIRKAGLQDTITMCGELSQQELYVAMQSSRLFLHTSSYEGYGMVCLEASYAGATVISFTRPMETLSPNWHVVKTAEEMVRMAVSFLRQPRPATGGDWKHIDDCAVEFAELFP